MAQVIVRNLDDSIVDTLKQKAALHGRSLEQELRNILAQAAKLGSEERLSVSARIRAMSGPTSSDSTELVREDRDQR